ncbi:PTS sugar transporter subunit IIB [Erysipelothrix larvae]|uniref:PTS sugar transporter subunit IIB n=1 Tax=Erysipelothrix larvae TaxID=1514105 RepID=A0A0X8GY07_9FIRM|nr:PTS sugar transporter subunit IIB [Erysipelothrix larvae]AMC92517.1 PTS sugar transporter subunit IIB [Erysipelothrix larvae]
MRKVILLCAAGMSTSMLVKKIVEAAKEIDYDVDVSAYSISEAKNVVPSSDIVLLGPQVRFNLKKIQDSFPDKPVSVIDMRDYGTMNGKSVVAMIKKVLKDD